METLRSGTFSPCSAITLAFKALHAFFFTGLSPPSEMGGAILLCLASWHAYLAQDTLPSAT